MSSNILPLDTYLYALKLSFLKRILADEGTQLFLYGICCPALPFVLLFNTVNDYDVTIERATLPVNVSGLSRNQKKRNFHGVMARIGKVEPEG